MKKNFREFLKEEEGQALTELLLLIAVMGSFVFYVVGQFLQAFRDELQGFSGALAKDLTTGNCGGKGSQYSFPDDCWRDVASWK